MFVACDRGFFGLGIADLSKIELDRFGWEFREFHGKRDHRAPAFHMHYGPAEVPRHRHRGCQGSKQCSATVHPKATVPSCSTCEGNSPALDHLIPVGAKATLRCPSHLTTAPKPGFQRAFWGVWLGRRGRGRGIFLTSNPRFLTSLPPWQFFHQR